MDNLIPILMTMVIESYSPLFTGSKGYFIYCYHFAIRIFLMRPTYDTQASFRDHPHEMAILCKLVWK